MAETVRVRFVDRGEDVEPLVYVDGAYQGSLDQLFVEELLEQLNGKLLDFGVWDE